MKKDNYSTIIDFGSRKLRLGVFDNKLSKLFFQSKTISQNTNYEEYLKSINFLIREAENKISSHLENISVLFDTSDISTIDLSIKKKLDQKIFFKDVYSSIILEANQLIKDCYINKKIIHFIIKKYIINGEEFSNTPNETSEIKSIILEVKFICLPYNSYKNIIEIFKKNNLKILNFSLTSLVKSFRYLNSFKENKIVAFLDIGLNRTTLILFINQKLEYLNSIPIGGNHVSKDISKIMKLSFDESENLKKTINGSDLNFTYYKSEQNDQDYLTKKFEGKNIKIELLKKVVLARAEELIQLSFKDIRVLENINKEQNLNLVLIGDGSKIFNKNSFQIENKYNFKEISFYEENDFEICEAGLAFKKQFIKEEQEKLKKNHKKMGFFHKFFNLFANS